MYILYNHNQITIRWRIFRGVSEHLEDFSLANVKVMLCNGANRFPCACTLQTESTTDTTDEVPGSLRQQPWNVTIGSSAHGYEHTTPGAGTPLLITTPIDPQLPAGVYSIEAVWSKNNGRSVARSRRDAVLAVTANSEESTDHGAATTATILNIKSSAATFGYDGLSAYELALLTGQTTKTQEEWIADAVETALNEAARKEAEIDRQAGFEDAIESVNTAILNNLASIEQTATSYEDRGENIITATLGNGTTVEFTILNGGKGSKGDKGDKGDQGNSGYQGAAGELEVKNNWTGGADAALSAEKGKELHDTCVFYYEITEPDSDDSSDDGSEE